MIDLGDSQGERMVENVLPIHSKLSNPDWSLDLPELELSELEQSTLTYIEKQGEGVSNREIIINVLGVDKHKIGSQHYKQLSYVMKELNRKGVLSV